ncbi:MAG: LacI family DNA-binding transcriptional regulator [Pseudomonadota bacterium]
MTTMLDVARRAGVSVKTVSRVINNEPYVQDALRERVKLAARDLGYVPSASARSLRSHRSYQVQLISHIMTTPYVHAIQAGAMQTCQAEGYQLLVAVLPDCDGDPVDMFHQRFERQMAMKKPDGVILVPPFADIDAVGAWFSEQGVAVAKIGTQSTLNSVLSVRIDEFAAARDLTMLLIEQGHRQIGFIRGRENESATEERFRGYRSALDERGVPFKDDLVVPGTFDFASGVDGGMQLLARSKRPTAVFASNDDMAAGVIVAGHRLGLVAPRDFSIVGFDDSAIAEKTWPALTTVRQPVLEFGTVAATELIRSFEAAGRATDSAVRVLDHRLVARDSVAKVP